MRTVNLLHFNRMMLVREPRAAGGGICLESTSAWQTLASELTMDNVLSRLPEDDVFGTRKNKTHTLAPLDVTNLLVPTLSRTTQQDVELAPTRSTRVYGVRGEMDLTGVARTHR